MTRRFGVAIASAFLLAFTAAPARADVVLSPFVGGLFGGDLPDSKVAYGGSAAFMGAGVIGAEVEFTYSHDFIAETVTTPQVHHANVMGNLIVGIPIGGTNGPSVRPYVVGGIGLFRTTAKSDDFDDRITSNDFGFNLGGGVMMFFTDKVGLRGDLRYIQALRDENAGDGFDVDLKPGDLNFWRGSIGLAFKF